MSTKQWFSSSENGKFYGIAKNQLEALYFDTRCWTKAEIFEFFDDLRYADYETYEQAIRRFPKYKRTDFRTLMKVNRKCEKRYTEWKRESCEKRIQCFIDMSTKQWFNYENGMYYYDIAQNRPDTLCFNGKYWSEAKIFEFFDDLRYADYETYEQSIRWFPQFKRTDFRTLMKVNRKCEKRYTEWKRKQTPEFLEWEE
jgi:hypothetical protein